MPQAIATELTFHYLDGRNESFTICVPTGPDRDFGPLHRQIRELMGQERWVLHLADKTVVINMNTVVKVEIQPPLSPQGSADLVAATPTLMAFSLNAGSDRFDSDCSNTDRPIING